MNYSFRLFFVILLFSILEVKGQGLRFFGGMEQDDQLGFDIAMTESFAVSSAWKKDIMHEGDLKEDAGCVYLHKKIEGQWEIQKMITHPDPGKGDAFGRSIAISDDYLVVGVASRNAVEKIGSWAREGAVCIYQHSAEGYAFQYELKSDKLDGDARFGEKVALGDGYLAVVCGYPKDGADSEKYVGAVLVYSLAKEAAPRKIASLVSQNGTGFFGYSIAIRNDLLVIGEDDRLVEVYRLQDESVELVQQILPEEGFESGFGADVAVSNDFMVVGATGGDYDFYGVEFRSKVDSVYVMNILDEATFRLTKKYIPNDQQALDSVGVSREKFRSEAVPYETWQEYYSRKGGAGAVYIYKKEKSGYKLVQTLMASDRQADDDFGMRVEITDDLIMVGAFGKAVGDGGSFENRFSGAAYAFKFKKGKWTEVKKYQAQNPNGWDKFGFSIGCSEKDIMIGCRFKDVESNGSLVEDAGTVYFYETP